MSEFLVRYSKQGKRFQRKFTDLIKAIDFYLDKCGIESHPLVKQRYIKKKGDTVVEFFDPAKFKIIRKMFLYTDGVSLDWDNEVEDSAWKARRYYRALCHDLTKGDKLAQLIEQGGFVKNRHCRQLVPLLGRKSVLICD